MNRIVTTVLSPLQTPQTSAESTAQTPVLWGVLAWLRRTFFNQAPVLTYKPVQTTEVLNPDGSITIKGTFTGVDPDGDALRLTVINGAHGTVTLGPDATDPSAIAFTYVPEQGYLGTDSFTITATEADAAFHIHGLPGLINMLTFGMFGDSGHTAALTVTVNAQPPVVTLPSVTGESAGVWISPDGSRTIEITRSPGADTQLTVSVINADNTVTTLPPIAGDLVGVTYRPQSSDVLITTRTGTSYDEMETLVTTVHSDSTVTTLRLSGAATTAALISADGNHAYQTTITGLTTNPETVVSVIDLGDQSVVALDPVEGFYYSGNGLVLSPDGRRGYLTTLLGLDPENLNQSLATAKTQISVINLDDNTITKLPVFDGPTLASVAVSPDGNAYLTTLTGINPQDLSDDSHFKTVVSVIDRANVVTTLAPINGVGYGVSLSPDGHRAYLTTLNRIDPNMPLTETNMRTVLSVINADHTVTQLASIDGRGMGVSFDDDGNLGYLITVSGAETPDAHTVVSVIDPATNSVRTVATVNGFQASDVVRSADGTHISIVTQTRDSTGGNPASLVSVIDLDDPAATTTVTVPGAASGVVPSADGSRLYLNSVTQNETTVWVVHAREGNIAALARFDGMPASGVLVSPDGSRLYQPIQTYDQSSGTYTSTVHVINATDAIPAPPHVTVVGNPVVFDGNPETSVVVHGTRAYVTTESSVTVVDTRTGATVGGTIVLDGQRVGDLVFSPQSPRVYQTTTKDGNTTIWTIDPIAGTGPVLQLPGTATGGLTVSNDGSRAYQMVGNTMVVINTADGSISQTAIPFEGRPTGRLRVSDDGTYAYQTISTEWQTGADSTAVVMIPIGDPTAARLSAIVPGQATSGVVLSTDGSRAYQTTIIAHPESGSADVVIAEINTADGSLVRKPVIVAGASMWGTQANPAVVLSTDGSRAFQVVTLGDTDGAPASTVVAVIDTSTGGLVADPIPLDGVSTAPPIVDGERVFLTVDGTNPDTGGPTTELVVIDTSTGTVSTTTVIDGQRRSNPVLAMNGTRTYLTVGGRLIEVDTSTGNVVGNPINLDGLGEGGIALNAQSTFGYQSVMLSNNTETGVYVVNTHTHEALYPPVIITGRAVGGVVLSTDGTRALQTTEILDPSTYAVTQKVITLIDTGVML